MAEMPKGHRHFNPSAWAKRNSFLSVTVVMPGKRRKEPLIPDLKNSEEKSRLLMGLRALGLSDTDIVDLLLWMETGEEQYRPKGR